MGETPASGFPVHISLLAGGGSRAPWEEAQRRERLRAKSQEKKRPLLLTHSDLMPMPRIIGSLPGGSCSNRGP